MVGVILTKVSGTHGNQSVLADPFLKQTEILRLSLKHFFVVKVLRENAEFLLRKSQHG
jgi:hypothetical protein